MKFNKEIDGVFDEMIRSLQGAIQIPSVYKEDDYPFGRPVSLCLDYMLQLSEKLGFKAVNMDGVLGWAEYGEGDEMVAVLGHLDVVPEGDGWSVDPYGAEIRNGKIFGRGTMDDKGPVLAALYGLKAIAQSGAEMKRRVRIIFGTNEESGSRDMKYYKEHGGEFPVCGFTPDGAYPLINGEKGLITELYGCDFSQQGSILVKELWGGTAGNIVPDKAYAVLSCSPEDAEKICARKAEKVTVTKTADGVRIDAAGISAHGGSPWNGDNAIGRLMIFMNQLPLEGQLARAVALTACKIGMETRGESMGVALSDRLSGDLSFNLGVLRGDEHHFEVKVNYRYPVTCTFEQCGPIVRKQFEEQGFSVLEERHKKNFYIPENAALIQKLLRVYADNTGLPAVPECIGGGTYAKSFPNVVAFGPIFPGDEVREHKPDEYMELSRLRDNANIIADAIYALAND